MYQSNTSLDFYGVYTVHFHWCYTDYVDDVSATAEFYEEYPHGPLVYLGSVRGSFHIRLNLPYIDDGSCNYDTSGSDDKITWTRDSFTNGTETVVNTVGYDSEWKYERNSGINKTRIRIDDGDWIELELWYDNHYTLPTPLSSGTHKVEVQQQGELEGAWGRIIEDEVTAP